MVTPRVETIATTENYGRFLVEPLESGFGITLGNALRRTLLSSLPGAAITWVTIQEVQHEFSNIPHMKEDTIEFLLNLKEVRLRPFSDRPGKLTLEVLGEGEVTAADIQTSADFEVANPEHHLATLDSPEASLTVQMNVEHGKGYLSAGSSDGLPIGAIPVDAIFTPMRKVNYRVEPVRIGVDNYDRLILEIWTDGTITAVHALSQTAEILQQHFALISNLGRARFGERQPFTLTISPKQYEMPIEELDLSVRAYNCLKRSGITKLGQILEMSEEDLLRVRNFGRKSLDELREKLRLRGLLSSSRLGLEGGSFGALSEPEEEEMEPEEED